jgi:hypothetical protein
MVCSFLILFYPFTFLSVLFVCANQALTFAVCISEPSAGAVGYILYYKTAKTSILFLSLPVVYNMGTEVCL